MAAVTIKFIGDDRLRATLLSLSRRTESGIMAKALREGSKPVIQEARANLTRNKSIRTLALRKSIGVRIRKYGRLRALAVIGPRYPKGASGHLVELGTGPRYSGGKADLILGPSKTGKRKAKRFDLAPTKLLYRGSMPAKPFMRPAFFATYGKVMAIIQRRAWDEIKKVPTTARMVG